MKKFIKNIRFIDVLPYIVFMCVIVVALYLKFDYHMDELLSYTLSNHVGSYYLDPEDGVMYANSMDPYIEYLAVQKGDSFSYSIPYFRQVYESHPPIYYALLHTVCSFFPETFSKWYGGTVNIIFALGTLFVLRRIIEILTDSRFIKNILTWGFVFCYAVISQATFFRMYSTTLFITTLITYIFLWQLQKDRGKWFYICAAFMVFVGSLTYYGTLIFSTMICVTYGIYLLINKKWKDVGIFCGSMAAAGVASVCVFPAIIRHIFGEGQGSNAINNFFNIADMLSRLKSYTGFYNDFVFGRVEILILLAIIILIYVARKQNRFCFEKAQILNYIMILVPSLAFFLVAAKSAPYHEERYTSLVYANAYVGIMCPLYILISKVLEEKKAKIISILIVVFISSMGLFTNRWQYLYRWEIPKFEPLKEYSDLDCLCIHGGENWRLTTYILELTNYKGLTFIHLDNIGNFNLEDYITTGDGVVVLAGILDDSVMDEVMKHLPNYSGYKYISERSFYVYK